MRFEHFIKLTGSQLLNKPWVDSFSNIQKDVSKIKQGDLFLCYDTSQIKQAIQNGAYAIVTEVDTEILDDEIAWIKTKSLNSILTKLLRYILLEKKVYLFYANKIDFELLKKITLKKEKIFLDEDRDKSYKMIINCKNNSVFVSSDKKFLDTISPTFSTIQFNQNTLTVVKKSNFLTSFIYDGNYFANIKLPPIFINNMQNILNFLNHYQIKYDIYRCDFIEHFKPVFVDTHMRINKFGTTSSVLIFEKDFNLFKKELNYLINNASWAKTIGFAPIQLKDKISSKQVKIVYYKKEEELFNLTPEKFNFALIFSKENSLYNLLKSKKEISLLN